MKSVVITGASRGFGAALVDTFAEAGWRVFATARDPARVAVRERVECLPLDLASIESIDVFAGALRDRVAALDLLINNAGMNPKDRDDDYFRSTFELARFDADTVDESLRVNALMPMQLASRLGPLLGEGSVVLNVSSWLGSIGEKDVPGHYGYAGSKALLNMFTKGASLELAKDGRSIVALNPGWMRTAMGGENAKRTPDEVAAGVLALHESGTLLASNGRFLNADGSEHAW